MGGRVDGRRAATAVLPCLPHRPCLPPLGPAPHPQHALLGARRQPLAGHLLDAAQQHEVVAAQERVSGRASGSRLNLGSGPESLSLPPTPTAVALFSTPPQAPQSPQVSLTCVAPRCRPAAPQCAPPCARGTCGSRQGRGCECDIAAVAPLRQRALMALRPSKLAGRLFRARQQAAPPARRLPVLGPLDGGLPLPRRQPR